MYYIIQSKSIPLYSSIGSRKLDQCAIAFYIDYNRRIVLYIIYIIRGNFSKKLCSLEVEDIHSKPTRSHRNPN